MTAFSKEIWRTPDQLIPQLCWFSVRDSNSEMIFSNISPWPGQFLTLIWARCNAKRVQACVSPCQGGLLRHIKFADLIMKKALHSWLHAPWPFSVLALIILELILKIRKCVVTQVTVEISYVLVWKRAFNVTVGLLSWPTVKCNGFRY